MQELCLTTLPFFCLISSPSVEPWLTYVVTLRCWQPLESGQFLDLDRPDRNAF
jgi:hypothetical protein